MEVPPSPRVADVTVAITCYDQQAYIEQALESVLAQDPPARTVIVTDDLSSDDSADVIEHWIADHAAPFRFQRNTVNRGLCGVLNQSLADSDTEFFVHLSGDDWMLPGRLGFQTEALVAAGSAAAFVASDFIEVDEGGVQLAVHDVGRRIEGMQGLTGRRALMTGLLVDNILPAPGMMVRSAAVREAGGWDESLYFEDYDLWLRLATRHDLVHAPGLASAYRVVGGSMSHSPRSRPWLLEAQATILRKHRGAEEDWDRLIDARLKSIEAELEAIPASARIR